MEEQLGGEQLGEEQRGLRYGERPGLRFACVLDGRGRARDLSWDELRQWQPSLGVLWIHLERDAPEAQRWLLEESGINPVMCEALLAEESRPRVEDVEEALLAVLRGVNAGASGPDALDLVPIHLWIDANRVISLRDKDHFLLALRDIREALVIGKGPTGAGDLFVRITEKLVRDVEPVLAALDDEVDHLDDQLQELDSETARHRLGDQRRRAIHLRRYLSPQREALFRLQVEDMPWLSRRDKIHLREVTDKVLRYVESLDTTRDRTTILHEDLTALVSERISKNANRLTALAAILLPPSLIAGTLGANVGGIPGSDSPWAFAVVVGVILTILPLEIWILRRLGWL
ncbi:MAG: zinc transporter ZntB [Alphaproteobacteria bacterium]|nr:zinc transporter ZntB [Alphaproteobacteria bacterium]